MSFASHDGILYLRIGNDVYEGYENKDCSNGTGIHFSSECSDTSTPDFSVSTTASGKQIVLLLRFCIDSYGTETVNLESPLSAYSRLID